MSRNDAARDRKSFPQFFILLAELCCIFLHARLNAALSVLKLDLGSENGLDQFAAAGSVDSVPQYL